MGNGTTTHDAMERIPLWLFQTIIGMLLTGALAWVTWASTSSWKHEVRITAVEGTVSDVKSDVIEIKDGQKTINAKLDRLIERRHQ